MFDTTKSALRPERDVQCKRLRPADLWLDEIHASYGGKQILNGVSLRIKPGDFVTIVGPNGAGKSTLIKVATGNLRPASGRVVYNDEDITILPPHRHAQLGMGYVIQGGRAFPSLSVGENLKIAQTCSGNKGEEDMAAFVLRLFPNLSRLYNRRAGLLSGGERQALAVGMMLARSPGLLLLDEPSAGLSPRFVQEMLDKIQEINRQWGVSILMVEQNVSEALRVTGRAVVLANGELVMETDRPSDWLHGVELDQVFLGKRGHAGTNNIRHESKN